MLTAPTKELDLPVSESLGLLTRLEKSLPGGDTRTGTFFAPHPLVLERGVGYLIWDVDGNEFIDLNNNNTAQVHGHAHPKIVEAVMTQVGKGTGFPAPTRLQAELAERVRTRFPSLERLRFTNSGSEAVMMAVRAARAFTERDLILMIRGVYHGSWDQVMPISDGRSGVPKALEGVVRTVEFGNLDQLKAEMSEHGSQVAGILLDPFVGGIEATDFFLEARRVADQYESLLIFDEVVSGRLHFGGLQTLLGVKPDMTCLGKFVGGGLPVGVFGGRAEIMSVFSPSRSAAIQHSGTSNGNPLTMAAGCASLDLLTSEEIERINKLGESLGKTIRKSFEKRSIDVEVGGYGSILTLTLEPAEEFHRAALEEGLFMTGRSMMNISTPMSEDTLDEVAQRLNRALQRLEDH